MTLIYFSFGALPYNDPTKGTHIIHAYISQSEGTRTDSPGDERRAAKDAAQIVGDIILRNVDTDSERLLCDGEMPPDVLPIYAFAIGVAWDRDAMLAAYKKMDYETLCADPKFTPVLSVGAELYNYTYDVLKTRERKERSEKGAGKYVFDKATLAAAKDKFADFCKWSKRRHAAWNTNKMRFACDRLKNGYCSPSNPSCPCYKNGRCVEVA